ncbi:MAG: leucine-rich repeat domain-containing protein [Phycisphaerae bacterium]
MITNKAVVAIAAAAISAIAMVWGSGCDGRGSADDSDTQEQRREETPMANTPTSQPTTQTASGEAPRVPLGVIDVPEGTPQGEWLEIGGHTPFLWCYRKGDRLAFSQNGPRVYLSVDGDPYVLAGIIVRSKEEALLLGEEAAKSPQPLTAWVYSAKLPWLKQVRTADKVNSIQVWEFDYSLLENLEPLTMFSSLESLSLRGCKAVANLQPLGSLTSLTSLDLTDCISVKSGTALSALTRLQWLRTRGVPIDDHSFLSTSTSLIFLNLGRHYVAGPGFLQKLRNLERLEISGYEAPDQLSDVLSTVPQLKHLKLWSGSKVILPDMPNLHILELNEVGKDFSRITHLRSLTSLTYDNLEGPGIDMASLASLTNLQQLHLVISYPQNGFSLAPLAKLNNLKRLHLKISRVTASSTQKPPLQVDLSPLESLPLESLTIEADHGVRLSLGPLAAVPSLVELNVDAWTLGSLAALRELKSLQKLDLVLIDRKPSDLDPLAHLAGLRSLTLRISTLDTELPSIKTLPSMKKLTRLTTLDVRGDIEDVSSVADLAALEDLAIVLNRGEDLREQWTADFRPLERLPKLKRIELGRACTPEQLSLILAHQPDLEKLKAYSLQEIVAIEEFKDAFDPETGTFKRQAWDSKRDYSQVLGTLKNLHSLEMSHLNPAEVAPLENLVYFSSRHADAKSFDFVKRLRHLRYFNCSRNPYVILKTEGQHLAELLAPLERLDALLTLRGIRITYPEDLHRQIDRGTYGIYTGDGNYADAEKLRKALFVHDLSQSQK